MTQSEFQAAVNAEVAKAIAAMGLVKPAKGKKNANAKAGWLAAKDQRTLKGFAKKGIANVVLMDRSDKSKEFNVRPFNGWVAQGRMVKKGEHGVNGLFHVSQTEEIPATKPAA